MATIPIEIILQDAESPVGPTPTPTPDPADQGESINIIVPDTGAGIAGGNDISSNSSVASIILPATLLVVALVAICTLLIHKHRKRQEDVLSRKEKLATAAYTTVAVLSATVLVGNLVMPATNAATSVEPGTADLEVTDKITITATREADGDAITATVKNTSYATANLDFGYKVTASMAEGITTANLYLDGDEASEYYFAPVTDGVLADNTWGYNLSEDSEDYLSMALSDSSTTITKGNDTIENKVVDIYYTIKAGKDMPAGTYTGELEYNIAPAVEYMQDFATMTEEEKAATLANMPEGKQYILKDIRDEKSYYISKPADGNVWMTQNLDLDIEAGKTYTSADTDLANSSIGTSWTPISSTSTASGWIESISVPSSYDPGNLYWDGTLNNNWDGNLDNETTADSSATSGGVHYHIGNYYNWTAAIAMNDSSSYITQYQDANQSICPSGWRLPNYSGNKSYQNLVNTQDLTAGTSGNVQIGPTYFVYDGGWNGTSSGVGSSGEYWSSGVGSYSSAYILGFYANGYLGAQDKRTRLEGYPIRCLVR